MVTGTQIANEILEMYKTFCEVSDCYAADQFVSRLGKKLISKMCRGESMTR